MRTSLARAARPRRAFRITSRSGTIAGRPEARRRHRVERPPARARRSWRGSRGRSLRGVVEAGSSGTRCWPDRGSRAPPRSGCGGTPSRRSGPAALAHRHRDDQRPVVVGAQHLRPSPVVLSIGQALMNETGWPNAGRSKNRPSGSAADRRPSGSSRLPAGGVVLVAAAQDHGAAALHELHESRAFTPGVIGRRGAFSTT